MATTFNRTWTTHPDFIGWLQGVDDNPHAAWCKSCHKLIHLSNMGRRAIVSHASSKKHKTTVCSKNVVGISPFLKSEQCSSAQCSSSSDIKEHSFELTSKSTCEIPLHANPEGADDMANLCVPPPPPPVARIAEPPAAAPNVQRYLQQKATRKAEILWALKSVTSHYSFRSNDDVADLFKAMFPDSNIAQSYNCSRKPHQWLRR